VILPESPKALALDGTLISWAAFVVAKGLPFLITLSTLVLIVLRIMIGVREYRKLDK